MSRTTRKRRLSFYKEHEWWFESSEWHSAWTDEFDEGYIKSRDLYYTEMYNCGNFSPDKSFRRKVNKQRRTRDKRELYKELNLIDYEGLYDLWNCKTANAWWYW